MTTTPMDLRHMTSNISPGHHRAPHRSQHIRTTDHQLTTLTILPTHTSRTTSQSRRTPLSTHWILVIAFKCLRTTALQLVHPQCTYSLHQVPAKLAHLWIHVLALLYTLVAKLCVLPFSQVREFLSVSFFWNLNPADANLRRSSTVNRTLSMCQSYHISKPC